MVASANGGFFQYDNGAVRSRYHFFNEIVDKHTEEDVRFQTTPDVPTTL